MQIVVKMRKPKPTIVYDTYWRFAAERQAIFFKRVSTQQAPWTDDPILQEFKFTNAYRATDRVSQYLINNVIYKGDQSSDEILFRILLFKLFNKIESWEALVERLGQIRYANYSYQEYSSILEEVKKSGMPIYSSAYIMASGKNAFGYAFKHQNHLKLLEKIIGSKLHERVSSFATMEELYSRLKEYPSIGPFLAYQYAIDINYSELTHFSEKIGRAHV